MKFEFYCQNFEKFPAIRFHGSLSSGRRVAPCGQKDRRTDMAKLIVVFFAIFRTRVKKTQHDAGIKLYEMLILTQ